MPLQGGRQVPLCVSTLPKAASGIIGLGREPPTPLQLEYTVNFYIKSLRLLYGKAAGARVPAQDAAGRCRPLVLELYDDVTLKASSIRTERTSAVVRNRSEKRYWCSIVLASTSIKHSIRVSVPETWL